LILSTLISYILAVGIYLLKKYTAIKNGVVEKKQNYILHREKNSRQKSG
jgi:hypothetical protein